MPQTAHSSVFFSKRRYDRFLANNPAAGDVAAKLVSCCDLQVMANCVRNSLPPFAAQAYKLIGKDEDQKKSDLVCAISGLHAASKIARRSGETKAAARWEDDESHFREILNKVKPDPRTRLLGALGGKRLPFAPLYLVCLEEYIAAKTGKKPRPSETAHIVSALLRGFDQYPPSESVDADLVAKKLKQFRKRNPIYMETVRRIVECDPSGKNELDRILKKPDAADRI